MTDSDSTAVWQLPAPPGRDVTKVRDSEGDDWYRLDDDPDWWSAHHPGDHDERWPSLLAQYGPLTDVTPMPEEIA